MQRIILIRYETGFFVGSSIQPKVCGNDVSAQGIDLKIPKSDPVILMSDLAQTCSGCQMSENVAFRKCLKMSLLEKSDVSQNTKNHMK